MQCGLNKNGGGAEPQITFTPWVDNGYIDVTNHPRVKLPVKLPVIYHNLRCTSRTLQLYETVVEMRFSLCVIFTLMKYISAAHADVFEFDRCQVNQHCPANHICSRGFCRQAFVPDHSESNPLPKHCLTNQWPNATPCVEWSINDGLEKRICDSNDVPPFYVPAYCP